MLNLSTARNRKSDQEKKVFGHKAVQKALEHKLKRREQKMFIKVEEVVPEKTKNLIPKRHAKLDVFPDKEDLKDVVDSSAATTEKSRSIV